VFDPQKFFDYCREQTEHGSMDPKWFPDFLRVVDEFEYTQTEKVLVRNLKQLHFDLNRLGDASYAPFTREDYESVRTEFEAAEKLDLLDR
jgi:hypothetical protein